MAIPLRNRAFDKISAAGSMTDEELAKSLAKDDLDVSTDLLNKILLDLEIMGIITVTWFTKDRRKIEVARPAKDEEETETMKMREREYEASFPGAGND